MCSARNTFGMLRHRNRKTKIDSWSLIEFPILNALLGMLPFKSNCLYSRQRLQSMLRRPRVDQLVMCTSVGQSCVPPSKAMSTSVSECVRICVCACVFGQREPAGCKSNGFASPVLAPMILIVRLAGQVGLQSHTLKWSSNHNAMFPIQIKSYIELAVMLSTKQPKFML